MSGLLHPVGPEPASVYWRRRAVVVLGVVAVLALVFWAATSLGGGSATPAAADASASPTAGSGSGGATPAASASPLTTKAAGACADTDIGVTVEPSQPSFQVGTQSVFVMKTQGGICL